MPIYMGVNAGTPAEMVCPGGEYAFVQCMIKDSLQLKGRIHWYTTMLGRKASLKRLRTRLHASGVSALRTTEFIQVDHHRSVHRHGFATLSSSLDLLCEGRRLAESQVVKMLMPIRLLSF